MHDYDPDEKLRPRSFVDVAMIKWTAIHCTVFVNVSGLFRDILVLQSSSL
jgi:hypothetical protein